MNIEAHANKLLDRYLEAQECECYCMGCKQGEHCGGSECSGDVDFDYEDSDEARWKDQDRDY